MRPFVFERKIVMTYSKGLFYAIARVLMLLLINVFSAIVSTTLFAWVLNLLIPSIGESNFKQRFFSSGIWSVLAWVLLISMLVFLFYKDGKKHSAYGMFDMFTITITAVFMFAVYFVPVLFMDKAGGNVLIAFEGFYFPCKWLLSLFDNDYMLAVLVGIIPPVAISVITYCVSHIIYKKRFPDVDWRVQNPYFHEEKPEETKSDEGDEQNALSEKGE